MDRQKTYDTIKAHAIKQGKKSTNGNICLYRDQDGLKCFIGAIIPDELYNPDMEGNDIYRLATWKQYDNIREYLNITAGDDINFLMNVQSIHDTFPVEAWVKMLEMAAQQYHLVA